MKRFFAVLLAAAMVISTLAGCAGSQNSSSAASSAQSSKPASSAASSAQGSKTESSVPAGPAAGDYDYFSGKEISVAVLKQTLSQEDDFNNMPIFAAVNEMTGIKVNFLYVEQGSETEKVNVMLTSDMPDAILRLVGESQIAANMDLFYDLSEEGLLDTYCGNVVADMEEVPGGLDVLTWPDGSIRSLPTGLQMSYNNDAEGIMVINKAWLDKVGKDIPTTTDQLYDVLVAFRDNDMDGDGDTTDEIPFEFSQSNWAAHIPNLMNFFGMAGDGSGEANHYRMIQNGKVVGVCETQAFRDYLEFCNKLASEGLLDVEGFSQTNEQYYAKLKEQVGIYLAWTPNSNLPAEEAANYVVLRPVAADGYTAVKTGWADKFRANKTGLVMSAKAEEIGAVLTWWNAMASSTEMKWTARLGEQGQLWDIVDGKVVSSVSNKLTDTFTEENFKYTYGLVDGCPMIVKSQAMEIKADPASGDYIRKCMVDQVADMFQTEFFPESFVAPEQTEERVFIETDLMPYINGFVANSIVYGVTDESWNQHLSDLKTYRYDEWIEWYQKRLDGTLGQ